MHAQDQYVVGASWSEAGFSQIQYSIDNGYLDACDAVAYHPYGTDALEQSARVMKVRGMIGSTKPLWLTEWNLHLNNNKAAWADQLIDAARLIAPYVQAVIHFRMVRTTQAAGYAAPYWLDGSTLLPTAGFSDKLVTALQAFA